GTRSVVVALALLVIPGLAHAQVPLGAPVLTRSPALLAPVNNENDLVLAHGVDLAFGYTDPSPGKTVGTASAAVLFASNDYFWKVYPKETTKSCSGTLEIRGLTIYDFDTDFVTPESSGNNTILSDMYIGPASGSVPCNARVIEPATSGGVLL